jgi:hypothetical protein
MIEESNSKEIRLHQPLARAFEVRYTCNMILIRFPNTDSKKAALAQLAGRYNFKSWASGEMLVPEDALGYLAVQGISFTVEGPANYERNTPTLRSAPPVAV